MKNCLLIITTLLISISAKAQRGLEAGAIIQPQLYTQLHCQTPTDKAIKIPFSFAIGVDLGYNFNNYFGIRTGLLYNPVGERFNDLTSETETRVNINLNYLEAPLYFKYNSNPDNKFSFLFIGGGYLGYLYEALQSTGEESAIDVVSNYKSIMPGAALGIGTQINLDRGGNINILWRSSYALDIAQLGGASSRNISSGVQLSYHYFLLGG